MKFKNRFILAFTIVFIIVSALPIVGSALTFTPTNGKDEDEKPVPLYLYSQSVYMLDLNTGAPIVDINSDEKLSPGYLTQLMTCAIILDKFEGNEKKLRNNKVSAGSEAYDELYMTGAPTADIQPFEEVSYYDLIVSMILCSSCEAANITAVNLADGIFAFTVMMNDKAKELGMENTKFSTPNGMFTVQNYTTARDLSKLCVYLVNNYPVFKDICAKEHIQLEATDYHSEGTMLYNNNGIVNSVSGYYYAPAEGIKVSNQEDTGRSMASYAVKDGASYLIVTLNAPFEKTASDVNKGKQNPDSIYGNDYVLYNVLDHTALYKWAFGYLETQTFINSNSEVTEAHVEFGEGVDYVNLKPAKSVNLLWPSDLETKDVKNSITVYNNIIAPIEEGDVLGKMTIEYNGEELSSVDLIATSSVKRSKTKSTMKIALAFFTSQEFKWALFIIIMLFSVYGISYFLYLQFIFLKINKKQK